MKGKRELLSIYFRVMSILVEKKRESEARRSGKNNRPRLIFAQSLLTDLNQEFLKCNIVLFVKSF